MINIEHLQKFIESSAKCAEISCNECWMHIKGEPIQRGIEYCWKQEYNEEMLEVSAKLEHLLGILSHGNPTNMISDEEFFELLKE